MSGTYDRWRLPELLTMVENDTDASATAHLQAWEQKHSLLLSQKQKLESLVADLATHWDPAKSEAAQAFIDQVKIHIALIDTASESAARIWSGLGHITNAIADTKKELQALKSQYDDSSAATHEFNKRAFPMLPDPLNPDRSLAPIPGLDGLAMRQHQERLDEQARAIMRAADIRVDEANPMIKDFPNLVRIDVGQQYDLKIRSAQGSGGRVASRVGYVPAPVFNPPAPSSVSALTQLDFPAQEAGMPILAGGASTPLPLMSDPVAPGNLGSFTVPESAIGVPPTGLPAYAPKPNWHTKTGGGTALPPGGVIGGQPMPTGSASRGGLPANGVIGGSGTAGSARRTPYAGSNGAIRADSTHIPPQPNRSLPQAVTTSRGSTSPSRTSDGGWQDRSFERYAELSERQDDDGENPWHVEQGVAPVLDAPRLRNTHDAGPGVIGLDR
ncbi:hypothetical protein GCM10010399_19610 [Dactylosporangium fulvum]|uniref:PPE family domain-containing protein n=1 Tax=Dactylosporangium fulvum TaxID=53359 RepID=A0ABY5W177_9ACTN|nr:hypothetical protein [Dactylosporangium fulvum]UWP83733.1 hypothetical protein Dfulv_05545 [Dactylosporangium fulvum]